MPYIDVALAVIAGHRTIAEAADAVGLKECDLITRLDRMTPEEDAELARLFAHAENRKCRGIRGLTRRITA